MIEDEIGSAIADWAVHLHRSLGPGLLEVVYEVTLASRLEERGFSVQRQVPIAIEFEGGYVLNFGGALMKDGITRTINGML